MNNRFSFFANSASVVVFGPLNLATTFSITQLGLVVLPTALLRHHSFCVNFVFQKNVDVIFAGLCAIWQARHLPNQGCGDLPLFGRWTTHHHNNRLVPPYLVGVH